MKTLVGRNLDSQLVAIAGWLLDHRGRVARRLLAAELFGVPLSDADRRRVAKFKKDKPVTGRSEQPADAQAGDADDLNDAAAEDDDDDDDDDDDAKAEDPADLDDDDDANGGKIGTDNVDDIAAKLRSLPGVCLDAIRKTVAADETLSLLHRFANAVRQTRQEANWTETQVSGNTLPTTH